MLELSKALCADLFDNQNSISQAVLHWLYT